MKSALASLALLSLAYGLALWLVLTGLGRLQPLGQIAPIMPLVLGFSLVSYGLRFLRWHWLLRRRGQNPPLAQGFLAYIAGFAFTASPGKLGELVRVRYLARMGTRGHITVSCFIFERLLDLAVLLIFSLLLARQTPSIGAAAVFVALILSSVLMLARWRGLRAKGLSLLLQVGWRRLALAYAALLRGVTESLVFFRPADLVSALALGLAAWGMQALGFVMLAGEMELGVAPLVAFAIQPTATLLGAASMVPGGIATTEIATAVLLENQGISYDMAIIAAITMRVATLWFSVVLGVVSLSVLELSKY